MKRLLAYLFLVLGLILFSLNPGFTGELFINSTELSNYEKIKNIRNKKEKPDKRGVIYVGQKGLILQNGYGIMEFDGGNMFAGYFHKGDLRDGTWIIKGDINTVRYEYKKKINLKKIQKANLLNMKLGLGLLKNMKLITSKKMFF
tara:strand:+ start:56 stop:490 length:435 start_codon:yes stop_codon:yes gene_type:complete